MAELMSCGAGCAGFQLGGAGGAGSGSGRKDRKGFGKKGGEREKPGGMGGGGRNTFRKRTRMALGVGAMEKSTRAYITKVAGNLD